MTTKTGIDAFGGNMPFLGGRRIATEHGARYAEWLGAMYPSSGDTDYVGYFFHRAAQLMSPAGTLGLIATNAIADGDNRRTVLSAMATAEPPFSIYQAETARPWPGSAQVLISTVFYERGLPGAVVAPRRLNGRRVAAINSHLRAGEEWPEPKPLAENAGVTFTGCFLRGSGFILEVDEAEQLLSQHPGESPVVRPFLTGDDLNNTADQAPTRYVVDFADRSLEDARAFGAAFQIVNQRVRPGRERLKKTGADADHRQRWWQFANVRKELREQQAAAPRLLATARVCKRPVFAFIDSGWTPSEQVVVVALRSAASLTVLQSRVHYAWLTVVASRMGEAIRYSAGDCFAPFPFPGGAPNTGPAELDHVGAQLDAARRRVAGQRGWGLTRLYSALVDVDENDPDLVELREVHEVADRAVLDAYGWNDIDVPPYTAPLDTFTDEVVGRLMALNEARSQEPLTNRAPAARPGLARAAGLTDSAEEAAS